MPEHVFASIAWFVCGFGLGALVVAYLTRRPSDERANVAPPNRDPGGKGYVTITGASESPPPPTARSGGAGRPHVGTSAPAPTIPNGPAPSTALRSGGPYADRDLPPYQPYLRASDLDAVVRTGGLRDRLEARTTCPVKVDPYHTGRFDFQCGDIAVRAGRCARHSDENAPRACEVPEQPGSVQCARSAIGTVPDGHGGRKPACFTHLAEYQDARARVNRRFDAVAKGELPPLDCDVESNPATGGDGS